MPFQQILADCVRHSRHLVAPAVLALLDHDDMREAALAADQDPSAQAVALTRILALVAMDPLHHMNADSALLDCGDSYLVNVSLHAYNNFLGAFMVSKSLPATQELVWAIERNLASRMFQAARSDRRLAGQFLRERRRLEERADEAYRRYLQENLHRGMTTARQQLVFEQADQARTAERSRQEARRNALTRRALAVSALAAPALAHQPYLVFVASVLADVLPRYAGAPA